MVMVLVPFDKSHTINYAVVVQHCLCDDIFSLFDKTSACDVQTDRQTVSHTVMVYTALEQRHAVKASLLYIGIVL